MGKIEAGMRVTWRFASGGWGYGEVVGVIMAGVKVSWRFPNGGWEYGEVVGGEEGRARVMEYDLEGGCARGMWMVRLGELRECGDERLERAIRGEERRRRIDVASRLGDEWSMERESEGSRRSERRLEWGDRRDMERALEELDVATVMGLGEKWEGMVSRESVRFGGTLCRADIYADGEVSQEDAVHYAVWAALEHEKRAWCVAYEGEMGAGDEGWERRERAERVADGVREMVWEEQKRDVISALLAGQQESHGEARRVGT